MKKLSDILRFSSQMINHHRRNQTQLHANNVTIQTFSSIRDITIAEIVFLVFVMFLVTTINRSMKDFTFGKNIFIREKNHYLNKIKEVRNKFKLVLSEDEQYELYKKMMEINEEKLSELNKKFGRKRLINIYYIIKKLLKSQGNKQYKK